jgi:hypothetical protein
MTVLSDIKKTIAQAQSLMGQYMLFSESTEDPSVKSMFTKMKEDMEAHIDSLNLRATFIENNNQLYAKEKKKLEAVTKK